MRRFRRLEQWLGAPVDHRLTEEHLQRLVDLAATENEELDFKQTLYYGSERDKDPQHEEAKAELAKAITAAAIRSFFIWSSCVACKAHDAHPQAACRRARKQCWRPLQNARQMSAEISILTPGCPETYA